ncbi:hypothetical protein [uncultured Roseibium sp.]|uniref:hypothetical protein n=1 Tax=uncultured Roseibium sp. TaxID=1936171 RepID=UPI003216FB0A
MAIGYGMIHQLAEELGSELRRFTIKPYVHDDLKTIGDKHEKIVGIRGILANVLIYGALALFGFGMIGCSLHPRLFHLIPLFTRIPTVNAGTSY